MQIAAGVQQVRFAFANFLEISLSFFLPFLPSHLSFFPYYF